MAKKKATRKPAKKSSKKAAARGASGKYSFVEVVQSGLTEVADVTRSGEVRLKKADVKRILEEAFEEAARKAASGERVRIPFLGGLAMREVKPRKAGRGINPFTGEEVAVQARPASRKPRFSFTKAAKEVYADKKNWK